MRPDAPSNSPRLRVMHVASGGFSGATQVALDLVVGGQPHHESLLVLRRKRRTPMARVASLRGQGVPLELVPGWSHAATILALRDLCRRWQPDIIVGHGFPEHLLARWAARWAGVARCVQVEHNMRERYTRFKRWQVEQLSSRTDAFVGVSDAVAEVLRSMGLPAERVITLRNGTALEAYASSERHLHAQREPAILMAARFGAQKDHETLIRSLVPLQQRHGLRPSLRLAGGGSKRHQERALALVAELGLQGQVEFLGHRSDMPQLLMRHQVAALSTHYEGMPLSLAEAMAAGCAVVGSDVAAVRETLAGGRWGWLAAHGQPQDWADRLAEVLLAPEAAAQRAAAAREHARAELSRQRMVSDYAALFDRLRPRSSRRPAPQADPGAAAPGKPWLSVLIPAHNPGPYLRQALDSVIGQLDERAEVLVFDDASTDGTAQLLQDTRARLDAEEPTARAGGWPTLRCIGQRPGVGVSAARNALLQAARGRWIWFLDADDCLRPGAVQAVRGVVQAHPGLQAVVVDHAVLRAAARLKHRLRGEGHRRSMPGRAGVVPCGALMEGLLARGQWHIWGKVLRRDAWPEDLRFPEGRVFEDLSVVPRLMAGIDVAWYLRQPLVDYRSNPTSILGSMNADKLRHWALALDDLAADPRFDRNWAEFVAQQALRLARVAQALPGRCDWIDGWWRALVQHQPLVLSALQSWRFRPRRWAAWWQARRLGWLRVQPPLVPREHGAPDDDDLDRST